ncbi:MAG: type II toxin-antitoxin system VapC family toxin [Mycobacteriales bacterium]
MKALLDTHVFLWLQTEPERVGSALEILAAPETDLLVSAASAWEIAIKYGLGRIDLPEPPVTYLPSRLRAIGASPLPVDVLDATAVANLPPLHRDPFDRLLVAQALRHDLTVVTADEAILRYDVSSRRVP